VILAGVFLKAVGVILLIFVVIGVLIGLSIRRR
jgi:hypothetical protein